MALEFSGEYRIPAPQQRVWAALNDPAVLQASIAGCRQLDKVSDKEFSAIIVAKVGPVSATFRGSVELSEIDAPNSYTLTGRGQGGAAGFARMTARVMLRPEGDDTVLQYTASADIGGKLASVGSRLVQSVAKKNADDFFSAFARQLGAPAALPAAEIGAPAGAPTAPARPGIQAPGPVLAGGGLGALVPAWLLLFVSGLSFALGYCVAVLR